MADWIKVLGMTFFAVAGVFAVLFILFWFYAWHLLQFLFPTTIGILFTIVGVIIILDIKERLRYEEVEQYG